jgi:hypothetical protein
LLGCCIGGADGTAFDGVGGNSTANCTAPRFITAAEMSSMDSDATTFDCSAFVSKWAPLLLPNANATEVLDLVSGGRCWHAGGPWDGAVFMPVG